MKNNFERYQKLKMEQKRLNDRIEDLLAESDEIKRRITVDSVTASDHDYPYTQHTVTIEGLEEDSDKIDNRIIKMELRRVRHMQDANDEEMSAIRQSIDEIDDEYMRSIITYRFIKGMSWRQVAFRLGGGNTDSAVRMAYNRYQKSRKNP